MHREIEPLVGGRRTRFSDTTRIKRGFIAKYEVHVLYTKRIAVSQSCLGIVWVMNVFQNNDKSSLTCGSDLSTSSATFRCWRSYSRPPFVPGVNEVSRGRRCLCTRVEPRRLAPVQFLQQRAGRCAWLTQQLCLLRAEKAAH